MCPPWLTSEHTLIYIMLLFVPIEFIYCVNLFHIKVWDGHEAGAIVQQPAYRNLHCACMHYVTICILLQFRRSIDRH